MLQGLTSYLRARADLALKSALWGVAVAGAAAIAVGFFCAAAFVALADRVGAIDACLIFGVLFAFVCAGAAAGVVTMRRRTAETRARLAAQAFPDPRTLAVGADLARLLGGRRAAAAGLIGAFVIGLLLSRSAPRK